MSAALPPERDLSTARQELLRLLSEEKAVSAGPKRRPAGAPPVPSFAQERMWVSERFARRQAGGTYTGSLVLKGELDTNAMQRALQEIFRRHEILRSSFEGESEPSIRVHENAVPDLAVHDLTALAPDQRSAALDRIIEAEAGRHVDLATWPLLQLSLVRLASDHHVLVLSYHHIVADGWSTGVFYEELGTLYSAFAAGSASPLPEPQLQYYDFAAWQREQAELPKTRESLEYFKQQFAKEPAPLELPADRARTASRTYAAGTHTFWIPGSVLSPIRELGQSEQTTPFTTLLAAFFALMSRCSGQTDLAVGSPVANRPTRETEKLIGCFMHPLVLRADLSDDTTFRSLLARVRQTCLDAYAHQDTPFELVMRALRPQWDSIHMPLFQVLFNVQPGATGQLELPGVTAESPQLHLSTAALDLSLDVYLRDTDARGDVEYSAELFDSTTVAWLMRCYLSLLKAVAANPDLPLSQIHISGKEDVGSIAGRTAGMSAKRLELLRLLAADAESGQPQAPKAPVQSKVSPATHPCSFGQERVWFLDQIDPQSAIYNQTQVLRLEGPLDIDVLHRALDKLVQRHDVLRTAICAENGRPVQVVHNDVSLSLPVTDLRETELDSGRALDAMVQEENRRPFDLNRPPLSRMSILRLDDNRHLLCLTVHHLVGDGWSMRIFRRELALSYSALIAGEEPDLPALPMQYADFARRQRDWYREAVVQGQLAYWKRRLGGEIPFLDLPTDSPRPLGLSYERNRASSFELSDELTARIHELCTAEGTTVFMVTLAAFLELMRRYTGQQDIAVDTPVSGRSRRELEGLIGFFVNSVVLRADLSGKPTFRDLVRRARQICLEAYSNQDLPFDKVVSQLQVAPERRGQPLTTVSFMLHETVAKEEELGGGVQIVPGPYDISDEFDLSMVIWQSDTGLSGDLQYDPRLFRPETAQRITEQFQVLLERLLADPGVPVPNLDVLPQGERQRLLVDLNSAADEVPQGWSLHGRVEEWARVSPDALALVVPGAPGTQLPDQTLTYAELNARANRIASVLRKAGVAPQSRVGVCLERSADIVVCVLAVLKAGAVYVPLDPNQGPSRLRHMLQDSAAHLVVTGQGLLAGLDVPSEVIEIDRMSEAINLEPDENPGLSVPGDALAYIIYTSGSTGRPKGVMVTHNNMAAAYRAWEVSYGLQSIGAHLQMASFSFDVFTGDLIRALGSGAKLVLSTREALVMPPELAEVIRRHRIECAEFVPAVVRTLMEHLESSGARLDSLKLVIVGSDTWRMSEYNRLRGLLDDEVRLINSYGVAEATIDSSYYETASTEARGLPGEALVPIGRPFSNFGLYVLDQYLSPVPIGAIGELYIAGKGLARGYSDRPDLTAERFLPNPFSSHPGDRLYRTGDRVRHLPDGNLAFLGRVDNQVKLRGFRIEPGEIESALNAHPRVRDAAVLLYRQQQLVAYVVPVTADGAQANNGEGPDLPAQIRTHLRSLLPDYMVPASIISIDSLPLSPNGKLDRAALPAPEPLESHRGDLAAPQTQAQKQIAAIWAELLGVETIGLFDNFFDLGGHSLLLFELQNRLRSAFGEEIPVVELFRLTTVEELSQRFSGTGAPADDPLEAVRQRARKTQAALQKQVQHRTRIRTER